MSLLRDNHKYLHFLFILVVILEYLLNFMGYEYSLIKSLSVISLIIIFYSLMIKWKQYKRPVFILYTLASLLLLVSNVYMIMAISP